jgi:ATP-dependent Lon protease
MISEMGIFPLPGLLLFPGVFLPLHIFEPRYRLMLEYCLESDYEIGITSISADGQIDEEFGWGKVIRRDFLPDGRSNIIVEGIGLAKLVSYQSTEPFIIAEVEKRETNLTHLENPSFRAIVQEILYLTKTYLYKAGVEKSFIYEIDRISTHSYPVEFIASILNISYEEKKEILLFPDTMEKAKILLEILYRINK